MMNNAAVITFSGQGGIQQPLDSNSEKIILQPHYIICDRRRSVNNELNAIEKITEDIVNDSRTKCDFSPHHNYQEADILE